MILSSDELEILGYIKSWNGKFVSLMDISRSAGGRQRFKETPNWARPLMSRLVDTKLVEVNERGHYRALNVEEEKPAVVGDDYFPAPQEPPPAAATPSPIPEFRKRERWISPTIATILDNSGKKFDA
ncbi:MAG TPA: hypothetical protein VFC07_12220 [Verrucomicrobiae bacterium]|nr:hypothetical protein [Verrucomicrobiae bacterium]